MKAQQMEYRRWGKLSNGQAKNYPNDDPQARRLRVEQEVERMLMHLDPDHKRQGISDTPERVAKMYVDELCSGYKIDPDEILRTFDNEGYEGMVILTDIPMVSICEHHLVPFSGVAHIGYFPNGKVVGLSKLKRLVDVYAKRLQIQERLTQVICETLTEKLDTRGTIIVIEAEHLCMTIRGVQAPGTRTVTSAVSGHFKTNKEGEKEEFFSLIGK